MKKYVWVILTNAQPGTDEEFNRWYDDVHVPDLLRIPGVVSAERYHLADMQTKPGPTGIKVVSSDDAGLHYKYLAFYVIETDDITAVLQAVADRAGTSEMPMSDTLNSDIGTMCYELISSSMVG